jgi:hypothetical protein
VDKEVSTNGEEVADGGVEVVCVLKSVDKVERADVATVTRAACRLG